MFLPELHHLPHKARIIVEHHAQLLEPDPFPQLPERPAEGKANQPTAIRQPFAQLCRILRQTSRVVRVVSPLHIRPVSPAFNRTLHPSPCHKINRVPQVLNREFIADLTDIALPILDNLTPLLPLNHLLLELRNHPFLHPEPLTVNRQLQFSPGLSICIPGDVRNVLRQALLMPSRPRRLTPSPRLQWNPLRFAKKNRLQP